MTNLRILILIGVLGAVGAIARYAISGLAAKWLGSGFPFGTLVVNVLGCFLIGAMAHVAATTEILPNAWRAGLTVGLLGGLTTFSTFGLETFDHLAAKNWQIALSNVSISVGLGLAAVWAGLGTARLLLGQ